MTYKPGDRVTYFQMKTGSNITSVKRPATFVKSHKIRSTIRLDDGTEKTVLPENLERMKESATQATGVT